MKKIYILAVILTGLLNFSFGQDLMLDHPNLSLSGTSDMGLSAELTIINTSASTLDVICENYQNTMVPTHESYFCWFVCYTPGILLSPDSITLAPGASTNAFIDHVIPYNVNGTDEITYRFYDQSGHSTDTLYVTITYEFDSPVGVMEVKSSNASFNFTGPNPTNSTTTINYILNSKQNAKLIVTNMLGSKVKEIPLNSNENSLTLNVRDLNAGIYIYSLYLDGKVMSSKKLVVAQH